MKQVNRVRQMQRMNRPGQSSGIPGVGLGYPALKIVDKAVDLAFNEPQRGLSSLFKSLEDFGTGLIQKNAPWVKFIPYAGPWLLKKAEKSLREKEEEAKKKREAAEKKKKAEKKADDALEADLKKAKGDPKKIVAAVKKHRKATGDDTEEKEKGEKVVPDKKAEPDEEKKAA